MVKWAARFPARRAAILYHTQRRLSRGKLNKFWPDLRSRFVQSAS
ncbi:MAG TPA: hypothetical protein [Caudoviricetes sp.]|nr:MAG TPA: hypothetical protein [Caudoviricetes sp.]